ncbi:MAG: class I SAM-dependent methyltransferase [Oscillospiraceae bacterium]|nr:class I SAM-dependent methyltransferase [Oscillospiraceae bacterium]
MKWNAELYQDKHSFVSEYGKAILEYVSNNNAQSILDIGCGTGDLTHELAQKSGVVIGIDNSESMIKKAKEKYPKIEFCVIDACNLTWKNSFDIVFSNAVFHWIQNQTKLLEGIYRALKIDGKLICEFGAHGCVAKIWNAFRDILSSYGYDEFYPFYYPTVQEYKRLLDKVGFEIEMAIDFDKPTILKGGKQGLRDWLKQFYASDLSKFDSYQQADIFDKMDETLYRDLWNGEQWAADYRRIRVVAAK